MVHSFSKMFSAVWNVLFFLTLCFIVTKFCVLAYKQFVFILTVALWKAFLCCVFKFESINIEIFFTQP